MKSNLSYPCGGADHLSRRTLLKAAGVGGLAWLTPLADLLAFNAEEAPKGKPARSVILLWLAGGPSQLETFDPHPGTGIAAGTGAIKTALKGVQFAPGLEETAGVMGDVSLIRSMVSKEGDHERAIYNIKTGYRPNPTLVHPSIGAIVCHELPDAKVEIPTHISILPNQWPARGGFFGARYDAFQVDDPMKPVPDVATKIAPARQEQRLESLAVVERAFASGRRPDLDEHKTLHQATIARARRMMTSDQLKAFDVSQATASERAAYGDTAFGRGCLAAVRLIEAGVRCVEVTLNGWDTHANNHEGQAKQVKILDPAFAALIRDLKRRKLLEHTVVLCGGEFGRTPKVNPVGGRDHWPQGFSMLVAGGGFAGGRVIGSTDPTGTKEEPDKPVRVEDLHATVQAQLGVDSAKEIITPVGRPIALSEGRVVTELRG
ncbi:MAG: DUF1501 domain-containing protein [Proteobacteria bacterium]|nr:DUF1501 domain-containing protein [Pseudomonadota bacterium]